MERVRSRRANYNARSRQIGRPPPRTGSTARSSVMGDESDRRPAYFCSMWNGTYGRILLLTRPEDDRDLDRFRPLDRLAWEGTQRLQRRKRLTHYSAVALGQRDQPLAQTGEVLFHR
jgi:hypothetical protein